MNLDVTNSALPVAGRSITASNIRWLAMLSADGLSVGYSRVADCVVSAADGTVTQRPAIVPADAYAVPGDEVPTQTATLAALPAAASAAFTAAYAAMARKPLASAAMSALTASDNVALRCVKAGVSFPAGWLTYVQELRAIVNGSDTTSTSLPAQPAYPAGS